jgi:transposase InsO family protein
MENQTGNKIRILRLDNGEEYTSNDFKDLYKEAGIKRELEVSYNPQ